METEKAIEKAILSWLNMHPDVLAFKFPRGGGHFRKSRTLLGPTNDGIADIIVNVRLAPIMCTFYLEVKRPNGKLRESQKNFREQVNRLRGSYYVATSVQDAKSALTLFKERMTNHIKE
jgi:hypothetical protein